MADQKIMNRIMALLERAGHPATPAAEARLCEEKADALMAQHMIDRMDLKPEDKAKIIQTTWDITTKGTGKDSFEFYTNIVRLLQSVLKHCGVRLNPRVAFATDENGKTDYSRDRFTLVGFPEDISYAEQIWFNVFKTFVTNINPQWNTAEPLSENVYQQISAGRTWRVVQDMAYDATPDHYGLAGKFADAPCKSGGPILNKAYREALKLRGEGNGVTRRNKAYRASFAQSYASTIGSRLSEMRAKAKEAVSDSDKFALAIRSTKDQVDAEFYRLFPEWDPAVQQQKAEREAAEEAARFAALSTKEQEQILRARAREQAKWDRLAAKARANFGRVRESDRTDMTAWSRGKQVADTVNLRIDEKVNANKRGEIK